MNVVVDSILVVAVVLTLASIPVQANAQRIYKCTTGAGAVTYQQVPCVNESETASVRAFRPVADTPQFHQSQPQPLQQQHQQAQRRDGGVGMMIGSQPSQGSAAGLQEKLANIASDRRYKGSPSARRAAMNAAMQEAGLAGAGPYQPPRAPAQPVHRVAEPSQIRDHSGNTYTQPPGSAFATDNKTGKQCFVFGDFVKCD